MSFSDREPAPLKYPASLNAAKRTSATATTTPTMGPIRDEDVPDAAGRLLGAEFKVNIP